jgi:hypothetical protein
MKIILKMVFQADPVNDQKRSAENFVSGTRRVHRRRIRVAYQDI